MLSTSQSVKRFCLGRKTKKITTSCQNFTIIQTPLICSTIFYVGDGNALPWWSQETIDAFTVQAQCFVDQYGNYSVPEIASIVGEENAHVLPFFYLLLSVGLWNFSSRIKILQCFQEKFRISYWFED